MNRFNANLNMDKEKISETKNKLEKNHNEITETRKMDNTKKENKEHVGYGEEEQDVYNKWLRRRNDNEWERSNI